MTASKPIETTHSGYHFKSRTVQDVIVADLAKAGALISPEEQAYYWFWQGRNVKPWPRFMLDTKCRRGKR